MRAKVLVFYCHDGVSGKSVAQSMTNTETATFARDASAFDPDEDCDRIVILDDVPGWMAARLKTAFSGKFQEPCETAQVLAPRKRGRPKKP